ncbi:hypothetical protein UT300007_26990 [Clostridium sp. CTA-7]
MNGVGYLGSGIPGVGLGCGLPALSFNRDGINAIKSMGTSVKNWFSNYSFFGTSRLGNLNGVGYLGARIPGVGLGCGLPVVSFNGDGITYAGTSIYNKIKSFISSIGDKYNKWVENRHINDEKAVIDLRDKNKIEWLDYTDEENIYTWEEVKKYIEGGIWGSGLYFGNEISDLPKQIIYKKGIYTYVSILEEDIEYFNGIPLNIGDPITLKDGTVIDHRLYKYKIVDTDEPPISAGIVSIPGSLRVPKVGNMNEFFKGEFGSSLKGVTQADKLKINSWKYAPDEELYLKYKDVFDNPKYYNQTTGEINWPGQHGDPNIDGFLNGEFKLVSLKPGKKIDRYGGNNGTFFADEGIPTENRAMAPNSDFSSHNVYEIKREIPMRRGEIAPWFDEVGGGIQYQIDPIFDKEIRNKLNRGENFIDGLIRLGYLKRL